MEIEGFWKYTKPFRNTEKGTDNRFGYGFYERRYRRDFKKGLTNTKRHYLRTMRKIGFSPSETWNLDCTIMRWLSDEFGGFFRECGSQEGWTTYSLDGVHRRELPMEIIIESNKVRVESYKSHLRGLLDNANSETLRKIASFCVPRLKVLKKYKISYPCGDDIKSMEDWDDILDKMILGFEEGSYDDLFIEYFFALWD